MSNFVLKVLNKFGTFSFLFFWKVSNDNLLQNRPLKFFLLVYAMSIPLWIIQTFINIKGLPLDIPITDILAAFTPLIAATILAYKEEGRTGIIELFKRIFDFDKIKKKVWYLPIVFLPFLLFRTVNYANTFQSCITL